MPVIVETFAEDLSQIAHDEAYEIMKKVEADIAKRGGIQKHTYGLALLRTELQNQILQKHYYKNLYKNNLKVENRDN